VDDAEEAPLCSAHQAKAGGGSTAAYFEAQAQKARVQSKGYRSTAICRGGRESEVRVRLACAPVITADALPIYRSRYYHSWWASDSSDDFDDAADLENEGAMNPTKAITATTWPQRRRL
jgi:hypothetical protein